ncbi:HD-GYP domain-containing protein [Jeotgalibacillus soli]|uniref:Histidine kinase n=1 Tax=Jeotgalibacillus soli TaxID=889306 RepID=A0A0C2VUV7_9BACL|nr:HD domain-containing phosphohydrolase [Jeotgalibacillus soli]KIL48216.1 histidine kinase [Jeotgalibacillus soli]
MLNEISAGIQHDFIQNLEVAENIILYHHAKWDGKGYPFTIKAEKIPFEERIVAVVDVFDALTSRRPYKDFWTKEKALSYINEQKGKCFDPSIVETFIEIM